jgi:hypothetical protein
MPQDGTPRYHDGIRKGQTVPTQDELDWAQRGLNLGNFIEQRLGVDHAAFVHPEHLVSCAHAAYLGDDAKVLLTDFEEQIQMGINSWGDETLARTHTTREKLAQRYPALIGNGNYSDGEIAKALRLARTTLPEKTEKVVETEFALMMARVLKENPSEAGTSASRLSPDGRLIIFRDAPFFRLAKTPELVVEYGPGAAAANRIQPEIAFNPQRYQTVFIEKGWYLSQLLGSMAASFGVTYPRFIPRMDGITAATDELLTVGAKNKAGLVMASMVHSAGIEELSRGIENAHELLEPGGVLAIQTPHEVKLGEAKGEDVISKAIEVFGEPAKTEESSYVMSTTGAVRKITKAVFVK